MLPISDFKYQTQKRAVNNILSSHGENSFLSLNSFGRVKIKFLLILALVLVILLSTQLVFATNLSTDGQTLSSIEKEIQTEETKSLDLRTKISHASSLTNLSQKARQLGFSNPEKIITP